MLTVTLFLSEKVQGKPYGSVEGNPHLEDKPTLTLTSLIMLSLVNDKQVPPTLASFFIFIFSFSFIFCVFCLFLTFGSWCCFIQVILSVKIDVLKCDWLDIIQDIKIRENLIYLKFGS